MHERAATPVPRADAGRVLVVEDEQDIAGLITHALERDGHGPVEVVGSGEAALRAVNATTPALVILDLNLPILSGFEVCRILRTSPATTPCRSSC